MPLRLVIGNGIAPGLAPALNLYSSIRAREQSCTSKRSGEPNLGVSQKLSLASHNQLAVKDYSEVAEPLALFAMHCLVKMQRRSKT